MEEQLISFETAKLAKEKGFNIPVRYGVYGKNMKLTENHGWEKNKKLELRNWNTPKAKSYSIPTQSLLQKWLREEHGIFILITNKRGESPMSFYYYWLAYKCGEVKYEKVGMSKTGCKISSYERALRQALKAALKSIEL